MANGHGGARPGAGRPRHADKYAVEVESAATRCADRLQTNLDNLEAIADGRAEEIEETWQAAGTVVIEVQVLDSSGNPRFDDKQRPMREKKLAFPKLPADQLVLIERVKTTKGPDRQTNEYLTNRVMGTPTQAVELTGEDGSPIQQAITIYLPHNGRDHDRDPTAGRPAGDVAGDAR